MLVILIFFNEIFLKKKKTKNYSQRHSALNYLNFLARKHNQKILIIFATILFLYQTLISVFFGQKKEIFQKNDRDQRNIK